MASENHKAALRWFNFGFNVIPITPGSKIPAVAWDNWFSSLSAENISAYWAAHPNHDIAFLVGEETLVLDADTPEAVSALHALEKEYRAAPLMAVQTTRGEHNYFRLTPDVYAKTDSHSTEKHPERIDVKTGRTLVILPPSTGKILEGCHVEKANDLHKVSQDFVDAVFQHNGRPIPRRVQIIRTPPERVESNTQNVGKIKTLLEHIDPDCGYEDWLRVLMAIYHETEGSDDGFEIADTWSSKGKSYAGEKDIRTKWNSFKSGTANPVTIATIIKMAKENGADMSAIYAASCEQFEVCETEVVYTNATLTSTQVMVENTVVVDADKQVAVINPLEKYSLRGKSCELEKSVVDAVPILGGLALLGQSTVFFAAPNTGKTALTVSLIVEDIKAGRVDPTKVFYLNMDDSGKGLLEKVRIAEEFDFHMLAEGHLEFSARAFLSILSGVIENDQANGMVVFLDTLKKFVDLMDKGKTSAFTNVIRPFVMKGGTVIALAHTNKYPGKDGKPVYGGVSDILNDIDCAYTIATVSAEGGVKVVEFANIKSRGSVIQDAAYSYAIGNGISYNEILLSVQPVDQTALEPLKQAAVIKSDAEVIAAVTACINEGTNTKMKLAAAAAKLAGVSKNIVLHVIERYTGKNPAVHRWDFSKRERGAMLYELLAVPKQDIDSASIPDKAAEAISNVPIEVAHDAIEGGS